MTLQELRVGSRFRTTGRRRILIKRANTSVIFTKEEFPGSAQYVQHDEQGNPVFLPRVEVVNSSGRNWNMLPETEVTPVP